MKHKAVIFALVTAVASSALGAADAPEEVIRALTTLTDHGSTKSSTLVIELCYRNILVLN